MNYLLIVVLLGPGGTCRRCGWTGGARTPSGHPCHLGSSNNNNNNDNNISISSSNNSSSSSSGSSSSSIKALVIRLVSVW